MIQSIRRERELLAATRGSVLDPAIANKILDDLFSSFVLLTGRDEHELPALLDPEWVRRPLDRLLEWLRARRVASTRSDER